MSISESHIRIARSSALLRSVSDEMADQLLGSAWVRDYSRSDTLILQGDRANSVFIVLDGWVKLYRTTRNGAEAVVGVITRGMGFGETMAFQRACYPVAAEAVTDCKVLHVEVSSLLWWMRRDPELSLAMLSSTFAQVQTLVSEIEQLKAKSGAQRVAEFLLDLCPCATGACTVTLPYEKGLIAARLGLKPESLSRTFVRLKGAGVTVRQSSAAIADVETLRAFAEEDRAEAWSRRS